MKNKFIPLTLLSLCSNIAWAATPSVLTNVTISDIGYDKNIPDAIFIRTSAGAQDKIPCHTDGNWHYVLKLSSPLEEKMYTAIVTAQVSKQSLEMRGSGLCDASYNKIESLHILYTH